MTNRPQLIMQGCLRRVAPGPAPKKHLTMSAVGLGSASTPGSYPKEHRIGNNT